MPKINHPNAFVLLACSHYDLDNKGRFFWDSMKEIGFSPGSKQYACMIVKCKIINVTRTQWLYDHGTGVKNSETVDK